LTVTIAALLPVLVRFGRLVLFRFGKRYPIKMVGVAT
jgi:hypothetical protein